MNASLKWLKMYVDIPEPPDVLAHDLTMFGLNVEEVRPIASNLQSVVYGRVLEVKKHPRADRLSLCRVDTGGQEPLSIVCGADNVRAGLGVAVALNGAVLPNGLRIKKTRIRGEISNGMICSETELGIGDDADGIIELDFEEKPGTSLEGKLGKSDVVLVIEVTPNRPDQLCHLGIAREIAALYKRELRMPELSPLQYSGEYNLRIENEKDCPRYTAAFIDDVVIGPSPDWMQDILATAGIKPINNIVDATNFVLLEMGQPLHAFDRETLSRDSICVRRARRGEMITTLDNVERGLDEKMLVIADGERPVAIAGIMGGRDTEVRESTRRVLLESAIFEPRLVRGTSQRLKLETEASYRFERGGDIEVTLTALERACRLIRDMGAGNPLPFYSQKPEQGFPIGKKTIALRVKHVNRVTGAQITANEISSLLERLDLDVRVSGKSVHVRVPSFRRDLKEEIDLVEEVARVYGYENIGREEKAGCNIFARPDYEDRRNENICNYMASKGFAEVITTSFMAPEDPINLELPERDKRRTPIRISNPLTKAQSVLRTSLLPGMLNVVGRNSQAERDGIRIFEMGKVFIPMHDGAGLPREELHLTAILTRSANPVQWIEQQRPFDFFDIKGELEALMDRLGVFPSVRMVKMEGESRGFIFNWLIDKNKFLAEGGLLSRRVSAIYNIDAPIFYFDMLVDSLPVRGGGSARFSHLIPYPAVKRDLCVVAAARVTFSDIRDVVIKNAKFLEYIRLFDYYRGGHLDAGKRSYTFSLSFRSSRGTLDDNTVDREIDKILAALQRELQVALREE